MFYVNFKNFTFKYIISLVVSEKNDHNILPITDDSDLLSDSDR
jgi:hypothetical protein